MRTGTATAARSISPTRTATKEITKADTVTAKLPPKITAGDGAAVTQGEKKELTFTSDASFADFVRVELDGTTLEEKNYTKRGQHHHHAEP